MCALERGCMTGLKELIYGFDLSYIRESIIEVGLLTNLAGFGGANSSHKLVIGLQAALREHTDTVAVITFN